MEPFRATIFAVLVLTVGLFLGDVRPAHAYIDPGTGAYLWQLLVAGIFGLLFVLRGYWSNITAFFSRKSGKKHDEEP